MIPLRDNIRSDRRPVVTVMLIVACTLLFLLELVAGSLAMQRLFYSYGMIPAVVLGQAELDPTLVRVPAWASVITSMFLHGSWLHLLGNMLYLWIFGANIESRLGHAGFVLFYLLAGIAAAVIQILPDPGSEVPMVGASGAISGVLGAYLVLYPHARVLVLIPISIMFLHQIRAGWLLGVWLLVQLVSALFGDTSGGVAWWAHVGGFGAGALMMLPLALLDRRRRRLRRRGPWG